MNERLSVVVITHNRSIELQRTLARMRSLAEQPAIVVVDNASTDSTRVDLPRLFPEVLLIALPRNIGAAARNVGVQAVRSPYVAFCDDDTWWAGGALARAAALLDAHPEVAVLCARVLVGAAEREDPTCLRMACSPLPRGALPGPALLGFLAGAAVIRRAAFLTAGGYEARFFIGGEEALLSLDLVVQGWRIVYVPQLVVHHFPSLQRDAGGRKRLLVRNGLWLAWLRLPIGMALQESWRLLRSAAQERVVFAGLLDALKAIPWVIRRRKVIPPELARMYRLLHR